MLLLADTQSSILHLSIGIPKICILHQRICLSERNKPIHSLSFGIFLLQVFCFWSVGGGDVQCRRSRLQEQTVESSTSPGDLFTFKQAGTPLNRSAVTAETPGICYCMVYAGPLTGSRLRVTQNVGRYRCWRQNHGMQNWTFNVAV
jgi:hypothetical protein